MTTEQPQPPCPVRNGAFGLSRRAFLAASGATVALITLPGCAGLPALRARKAEYPRKVVGRLSELEVGKAVAFTYPWDEPSAMNFLIRLAEPAGGGVGPDRSVVAFNSVCTHQGGPLSGLFRGNGVAGPCPLHWTTFDLTRHGMVVSGHATEGLPQIVLETSGDEIAATGVLGLIFGQHDQRAVLRRGGEA